jgi:hypothetical protein
MIQEELYDEEGVPLDRQYQAELDFVKQLTMQVCKTSVAPILLL